MSLWLVLLNVGHLLSVVGATAPGDGDSLCYGPPFATSHPSNVKILMDSFDYFILLLRSGRSPKAAWQHVDIDSNNVPYRPTVSYVSLKV
jgi:hypothetical protein